MRFKSALFPSAVALALAASAAPAFADVTPDISLVHGATRLSAPPLPCPAGEKGVWVDRDAVLPRLYVDRFGRITFTPGVEAFHGWECHPISLVAVGP